MTDHVLFEGEIITKKCKYIYEIKKIHFSRTTEPISAEPLTKHSLVNRIQNCSNEGQSNFSREDKKKIAIYIDKIKNIFFYRTDGPLLTKNCH